MTALCGSGCGSRAASSPPQGKAPAAVAPAPPGVRFTDVTREAGIRFEHRNGARGRKYFPETCGSGGAFLDYDGDGRLDILLVNGRDWSPQSAGGKSTLALYRGCGDGKFEDMTRRARLDVEMYGMGCAIGDYDNDGRQDLYVTAVAEPSRLFRNRGDGAFEDVTRKAEVDNGVRWGSSCAWLDYDRDGWLDLFVGNYIQWTPATDQRCENIHPGRRSYCTPEAYAGESCRLYRNNRDGAFEDVSRRTGIYSTTGKTLGVAVCDFDDDGWPDVVVANDTQPNFLYHNQRNGTFRETGMEQGLAYGEGGRPRAGMGIDAALPENNGQTCILVTNFSGEGNAYFRAEPGGGFADAAATSGMVPTSAAFLGWGAMFLDFDLDGWRDAFLLNGHIDPDIQEALPTVTYAERPLLFRQHSSGQYVDVAEQCGLSARYVGRGAAAGDYDNDGDLDLLVMENGRSAHLLRNDRSNHNHWLQLKLVGVRSNRSALGARVRVRAGGIEQIYDVRSGSSYLSQSDLRVTVGLGTATTVNEVEIRWPTGKVQRLSGVGIDREIVIREGGDAGGSGGGIAGNPAGRPAPGARHTKEE